MHGLPLYYVFKLSTCIIHWFCPALYSVYNISGCTNNSDVTKYAYDWECTLLICNHTLICWPTSEAHLDTTRLLDSSITCYAHNCFVFQLGVAIFIWSNYLCGLLSSRCPHGDCGEILETPMVCVGKGRGVHVCAYVCACICNVCAYWCAYMCAYVCACGCMNVNMCTCVCMRVYEC